MKLDALITFTRRLHTAIWNRTLQVTLLNMIKTNKRIRILKTDSPFKLLRRVSPLSNCMLFASPSKFCLRRFITFCNIWGTFLSISFFVVRTRTWLICYLVRTNINFAHFAGFSGIIIRGPNRSEIDRHLCRRDGRISRNPSQNAAFFT